MEQEMSSNSSEAAPSIPSSPAAASAAQAPVPTKTAEDPLIQYIILRRDLISELSWNIGSLVSQACHAAVAVVWENKDDEDVKRYISPSMHKVTLEIKDEESLRKLSDTLSQNQIKHHLWMEQPENFPTCIAVKPYPKSIVAAFVKKLRLFK